VSRVSEPWRASLNWLQFPLSVIGEAHCSYATDCGVRDQFLQGLGRAVELPA